MHEPVTTSVIATHGLIALFGALAHALEAHRNGTSKTMNDFIALLLMASFSGVIFGLVGLHMFEHQLYISHALAGTGAFLGVEGMSLVTKYLSDKIKK